MCVMQRLSVRNDLYTYRCGFLIPIQRFYSYEKRMETDQDILHLLKIVENCRIWKKRDI